MGAVDFSRAWAMPSPDTFSIKPIRQLVRWYASQATISVDPFARNSRVATYTNDMNPDTAADCHMNAPEFLAMLAGRGVVADLILYDPPYSPRQVSECYSSAGLSATKADTQNGRLLASVKVGISQITREGSVAICCGWNSSGMGDGWVTEKTLLVCHGGAHNDTICVVQRRANTAGLRLVS